MFYSQLHFFSNVGSYLVLTDSQVQLRLSHVILRANQFRLFNPSKPRSQGNSILQFDWSIGIDFTLFLFVLHSAIFSRSQFSEFPDVIWELSRSRFFCVSFCLSFLMVFQQAALLNCNTSVHSKQDWYAVELYSAILSQPRQVNYIVVKAQPSARPGWLKW